jgi:phosphoribosylformylglycinamidine synthase subunit PurQ / glutaminase
MGSGARGRAAADASGPPRIAVVTFPGSNDDGDACLALDLLGADPVPVWHTDDVLPAGVAGVVLPGGFSYGDYLRCGAIARLSPVMGAVSALAAAGAPVLGICNGFQVLCESGLLPGALRPNRQLEFVCRDVGVVVASTRTDFTRSCASGERLVIPVKHGEGNWHADDAVVSELEAHGRIALRYEDDVNGSVGRVAGVSSAAGNVLGLMPHPEHAVDPLLGPTGGLPILSGLIDAARAFGESSLDTDAAGSRTRSLSRLTS